MSILITREGSFTFNPFIIKGMKYGLSLSETAILAHAPIEEVQKTWNIVLKHFSKAPTHFEKWNWAEKQKLSQQTLQQDQACFNCKPIIVMFPHKSLSSILKKCLSIFTKHEQLSKIVQAKKTLPRAILPYSVHSTRNIPVIKDIEKKSTKISKKNIPIIKEIHKKSSKNSKWTDEEMGVLFYHTLQNNKSPSQNYRDAAAHLPLHTKGACKSKWSRDHSNIKELFAKGVLKVKASLGSEKST